MLIFYCLLFLKDDKTRGLEIQEVQRGFWNVDNVRYLGAGYTDVFSL